MGQQRKYEEAKGFKCSIEPSIDVRKKRSCQNQRSQADAYQGAREFPEAS
tara:strand:+ start:206 stop:355 length:150 start_codon:yes stop_codon:yes gene_type:complete